MSGEVGVYKPTLLDVSVSLHEPRRNGRASRQPIRVNDAVIVFPLRRSVTTVRLFSAKYF